MGDEIGGKAGKVVVGNFTDAALANFDQFAGAGKMIVRVISR